MGKETQRIATFRVLEDAFQGEKTYVGEVTVGDQMLQTSVTVKWDISIPIEHP